ncbi:hypothetical protein [Chryseobacterium paridis]|uniref:Lipoprotein n=1 Tax=Chryseobacterium paridis TaxID=2800328 RepID=A0ABS1FQZ4_9FLAO|nr:hypothetical protein [Chryseobacterium paridis]MBK1894648.1 hypothetical protein [Chryseobacterium paridis]
MNLKLILSGIALTSLLVACADRSDEDAAALQPQTINKLDTKGAKVIKAVRDTVKTPGTPNGSDSKDEQSSNETIDPTKPDRPK